MSYIKDADKAQILEGRMPANAQELNYFLTVCLLNYIEGVADPDDNHRYQHYNDVMGVLEMVKMELYRRSIVPVLEDNIQENGDIYPSDEGEE